MNNHYYVYVYIDPRNFEEFYYGKGKGSRKDAHLYEESDTNKAQRIAEIRKAGREPIVRVIAAHLTEPEALLIEKTLLWKLGKWTTNVSSGHFSDKFRPNNTLHIKLAGFDYQNGLYFYNVGEGTHREGNDYREFGFISGGQREVFGVAMRGFQEGDVFAAYLNKCGFVGIGRITKRPQMIREVKINGQRLLDCALRCKKMGENGDDPKRTEYVALVDWIKTLPREEAKWKARSGLYTPRLVRASLDGQPKTIAFLEEEFGLNLRQMIA